MDSRISSSWGFVDTELGQRLAWPAIGLQENIRVRYSIDISMLLNDSYLDMAKCKFTWTQWLGFFPPKENMASCGIFIVLVSGKPLATLDVRNYALCTTQLCIRVKVSASRDLAFVKQVVFTKHVVCALQQAVMVSHPEPLIFALLTQWTQLEGCTGSKG